MVLLAFTGGAFYKEVGPGGNGLRTWSAEFPATLHAGAGGSGTATDGQTSGGSVNFGDVNVTTVTFLFTWTDNYRFATVSPAGATFKVTSPLGETGESIVTPGQATATSITIREVCNVPDPEDFKAATEADAARMAKTRYPANENGTGDWTIEITVTRDYMTPIHPTGSIAWTATTKVTTYMLELTERLSG